MCFCLCVSCYHCIKAPTDSLCGHQNSTCLRCLYHPPKRVRQYHGQHREEQSSCSWEPCQSLLDPGATLSRGPSLHKQVCLCGCTYLCLSHGSKDRLCCFPLSKHHLSPPSFNKVIQEDKLIVAFPLNCISRSCLWDTYKFQYVCTLSFQLSSTFYWKDINGRMRAALLLCSQKCCAPCFCAAHCGWGSHTTAVFKASLLRLPFINTWDCHLTCPIAVLINMARLALRQW